MRVSCEEFNTAAKLLDRTEPPKQKFELQLIPVLFERHADQLASGSNAGFGEELLQRSFDGGLGNLQSIGDLFVGQPFKDEREYLFLPLGKFRTTLIYTGRFRPV